MRLNLLIYEVVFIVCTYTFISNGRVVEKPEDAQIDVRRSLVKRASPIDSGSRSDEDGEDCDMELYAQRGEIIPGFTFRDALTMIGKMYNSHNIRHVLNIFCSDAGVHLQRLLCSEGEIVGEVCSEIASDTRFDTRDYCEMIFSHDDDYDGHVDVEPISATRRRKRSSPSDDLSPDDGGFFPSFGDDSWGLWWPEHDLLIYETLYHDFIYAFKNITGVHEEPTDVCNYLSDVIQWNNTEIADMFTSSLKMFFKAVMHSHGGDCVHYINEMMILEPNDPMHGPMDLPTPGGWADGGPMDWLADGGPTDGPMDGPMDGPFSWWESGSMNWPTGEPMNGWGYSPPPFDALDYIRVAFTFLGRYNNSHELCRFVAYYTTDAAWEGRNEYHCNETDDDVADRMVETFYDILYDAQVCEMFLHAFEEEDLPLNLEENTGYTDPRELCEKITETMSLTQPTDYTEADFGEQPPDDDRWPGLDLIFSSLTFTQVLGVFGDMKKEQKGIEAMNVLCQYLEPGFGHMNPGGIPEFCSHLYENDDIGMPACVEVVDEFNTYIDDFFYHDYPLPSPVDEHSDVWNSDVWNSYGWHSDVWNSDGWYYEDEVSVLEETANDLCHALRYTDKIEDCDPHDMCKLFTESVEWDYDNLAKFITDVLVEFFVNTMMSRSSDCSELIREYDDATQSSDGEPDILDYMKATFVFLGDYENGYEMCEDIVELFENYNYFGHYPYSSSGAETSPDRRYEVAGNFMNKLYSIAHDPSVCESFFIHFEEEGYSIPIQELTGYSRTDMCRKLALALDITTNNVRFENPAFPPELPSDFDLEENLFNEDTFLPYVTFDQFIGIIGEAIRKESGIAAYRSMCTHLDPLLRLLEITDICSVILDPQFVMRDLTDKCVDIIAPIYGYPPYLIPIDFDRILEDLMGVVGYNEELDICPNVDNIINGDKPPKQMIIDAIDIVLGNVWKNIVAACRNWQDIIDMILPESSDDSEEEDLDIVELINYADQLLGIVTGYGSLGGTCDAIVAAEDAGDGHNMAIRLRERGLGLMSNVDRCTKLVTFAFGVLSEIFGDPSDESSEEIYTENGEERFQFTFEYITGFDTHEEFCVAFTTAMTDGQMDEECRGVVDCAGICNGDQETDCLGLCNGRTETDCAGECGGTATRNECGDCVGGRTGIRESSDGRDQCGYCINAAGYIQRWDCGGTCNGTAFIDPCNECVGGSTGKAADYNANRLDCLGICNSVEPWVIDTCGECEPAISAEELDAGIYFGGSRYTDCSDECVIPGFPKATVNECGECVGGSTGLDHNFGKNECGQCIDDPAADESSCMGCDGVPNSGLKVDACGVCGGTGLSCLAVDGIYPNFIPANQDVLVSVAGAGFTSGSMPVCIFTSTAYPTFEVMARDARTTTSGTILTCNVNLNPGDYDLQIRRDNDVTPAETDPTLKVYDDVVITSVSPLQFTIDRDDNEQEVDVVAFTDSNLGNILDISPDHYDVYPSILITNPFDGHQYIYYGEFSSETSITVNVPVPRNSGTFKVVMSINGEHRLRLTGDEPSVNINVYYPAPRLESIQFTTNGAGLMMTFLDGVDYNSFRSCADVIQGADSLGDGAECKWLTPMALFILFGNGDNLPGIGDSLTLKPGSLRAFRQELSEAAEGSAVIEGPDSAIRPKAILSGSEQISSCGNVKLDGRRSTGSGARQLTFQWSVTSQGSTTDVDTELNSINGGSGSPAIVLNGTLIDVETVYEFMLTVTNFLGQSDTATFSVTRSAVVAPQVTVSVKGTNVENVKVSDSFLLAANVFNAECVPPGKTEFEWSVDNTDVTLNLKTMRSRSLFVPANSLPGGVNIPFTVKVYKSSDPNSFLTETVTVTTVRSDLVALIKGGEQFSIGRDSGTVQLDGSLSFDPDNEARDWVYEWQCLQVDENIACWSFDPDHLGTRLLESTTSTNAVLEFDALALEADKIYKFTLIVRKEDRSANAAVYILAVYGNPPRVTIEPVSITGIVKDDSNIYLTAFISYSSSSGLHNVTWTTDTKTGYGYIDLQNNDNLAVPPQLLTMEGFAVNFFVINKGVVERGSKYSMSAEVYQGDGQPGSATIELSVLHGPTSCDFDIDDYEELSKFEVEIYNCVTGEDAYPLEYQLFVLNAKGHEESVTEIKSSPVFSITGKPRIRGSTTRTYVMKVCDNNEMCSKYSDSATVMQKVWTQEAEEEIKDDIQLKKDSGEYSNALRTTQDLIASKSGDSTQRRRRRSVVTVSTEDVTDQLELLSLAISNTVLTTETAQTLLDQATYISIAEMSLTNQGEYITYIDTLVQVFVDADVPVPAGSAEAVLETLTQMRANLDPTSNADILASIESVQSKLMSSQGMSIVLGEDPIVTSTSDLTSTVSKTLLSGTYTTAAASSAAASVNFGTQLESLYGGAWSCGSTTCSGVTVTLIQYADTVDYLSTTDEDKNTRSSSIINVQLADPETGAEITVADLTDPITITIPLTNQQAHVTYECRYWDSAQSVWSTASVTTTAVYTNEVKCLSNHLSYFAVFSSVVQSTTDTPIKDVEDDDGDNLIVYVLVCVIVVAVLSIIIIVLIVTMKNNSTKLLNKEERQQPIVEQQEPPKCQPIRMQQPHPGTEQLPPPTNPVYPVLYPSAPPYDQIPPVTMVSPSGEPKSTKSDNYSSYVQACTNGMAPVEPPATYIPPPQPMGSCASVSSSSSGLKSTGHC
ncbi:uncharacterized protein [Antedon mediterranea]|uniref:uncharacterized protein n=1 Tax=Antedon mediterranea TaxID=105859 RepID=UPI003AF8D8ED